MHRILEVKGCYTYTGAKVWRPVWSGTTPGRVTTQKAAEDT